MERVTLGQFLSRASAYEEMPVQIDPRLRRAAGWSGAITILCGLVYHWLPGGDYVRTAIFFRWTGEWLASLWDLIQAYRMDLVMLCGLFAFIAAAGFVGTRLLPLASIGWHIVLFTPVLFAAANVVFLFGVSLPVFANLFIWSGLCALVTLISILAMGIVFRSLAR